MSKRAALIITDASHVNWQQYDERVRPVGTLMVADLSEQLLADLRMLADYADGRNMRSFTLSEVAGAAARVRAALEEA